MGGSRLPGAPGAPGVSGPGLHLDFRLWAWSGERTECCGLKPLSPWSLLLRPQETSTGVEVFLCEET